MYISNLIIKNYRNFSNFQIDLKPFTLIVGENNTGKTNLLEALSLIFNQEITASKKRMLELDDINYSAAKKFRIDVANKELPLAEIEFPKIKVEVNMKEFNKDQQAVVGDWFTNKDLTEARLTYLFRLREGWQKKEEWLTEQRDSAISSENYRVEFPVKQYEYIIFGGKDQTNRADFYFLKMLKMELLGALRDAKRELMASGGSRLLYRVLNNRDENKFSDIKKYLQGLKILLDKHNELTSVKTDIKEYLKKISLQETDSDNNVNFTFTSPEASEMLKKISMEYGEDPISVERNGLGRNNLLYISLILSHLLDQKLGSDHVYFTMVGIEEPEAHLHPHLQEHLAKNIANEVRPDLQLLLTSHSPYIATKLSFDTTFVLYKDQKNETQKHNLATGLETNEDTVKYLKKFLDATNSKMFFAKKIILVEGISEQILIPKFFELNRRKTLEQCGCNIINVNGVSFRHFLEIIKNGYFIKCLVLTDKDSDEKKEDHGRASKLKKDYEMDVIKIKITNMNTFEKDIIFANKSGKGREVLINVLIRTKPKNGEKFKEEIGSKDIEVDEYFKEIEKYKSEFAFNLQEELKASAKGFNIPTYITCGFQYIDNNDK